jgi:hypothetical protein
MTFAAKGPPRRGSADGPIDAVCLLSSSAADVQTNSLPQRPARSCPSPLQPLGVRAPLIPQFHEAALLRGNGHLAKE